MVIRDKNLDYYLENVCTKYDKILFSDTLNNSNYFKTEQRVYKAPYIQCMMCPACIFDTGSQCHCNKANITEPTVKTLILCPEESIQCQFVSYKDSSIFPLFIKPGQQIDPEFKLETV